MLASGGVWDNYKYLEVVVKLVDMSFLQTVAVTGTTTVFSLHPLVADWLHMRASQEYSRCAREAIVTLAGRVEDADLDLDDRLTLFAHVDGCLRNSERYLGRSDAWELPAI